jgi:hypothetical protein
MSATHAVTQRLVEWAKGDPQALHRRTPLVYAELASLPPATCATKAVTTRCNPRPSSMRHTFGWLIVSAVRFCRVPLRG